MQRHVDVLWLVEHVARELDTACAVAALARSRYGLSVEIRNLYQHIREYLPAYRPKVVVHPFVYFVDGALATEDVYARWPDAIHFNVAWEQIHYRAHWKIKAPADEAARKRTIHHAWGEFYRAYLKEHGVPDDRIFVNGHPSYQLYFEPYRRFFADRASLARAHGLDPEKRWVFVPENYRWAFARRKLNFFVSLGGDAAELKSLVDFSIPSLEQLLRGCREAANHDAVEIIVRPRPSVSLSQFLAFFRERVGDDVGRIRFIKEGSVREWVMASDVVVSSYSTTLIEAAVVGKPVAMFEPIPIPDGLHCDWYDHVARIRDTAQLVELCQPGAATIPDGGLRDWALANLLACGDPLQRLAHKLAELVASAGSPRAEGPLPSALDTKLYFNEESHEKDAFTPLEVEKRVAEWSSLLDAEPPRDPLIASWALGPVTNKTMDRDDLFTPDAAPLVRDLNALIERIYAKGVAPSSWVGTIPSAPIRAAEPRVGMIRRLFARRSTSRYAEHKAFEQGVEQGVEQRLHYEPLPGAADDRRFPWFLYWEIYWVMRHVGPLLRPGMRLLDAGGASSLFTCYLASLGYVLHSIDLNERLLQNGERVARAMGWTKMFSHAMDMRELRFPDAYFDHAFSICVFEHLDYDVKQAALREIGRCLKPGAVLALTFDYRNPAPGVVGVGKDPRPRNALKCEADIHRSFLKAGPFQVIGNPVFHDNWKSYLQHPTFNNEPYTFGAIFLRRT